MQPFVFRCPNTGYHVQSWIDAADDVAENDTSYRMVTCSSCQRIHWVNTKNGRTISGDGLQE
jgi:hypothetical protein